MDRKSMLLAMIRRVLCPGEVCVGPGSVDRLSALETRRALVVAARSAGPSGALAKIQGLLEKAGGQVRVWSGPSRELTLEWVRSLLELATDHQPDVLVAVGGGSVIDGMKLLRAFYENPAMGASGAGPLQVPHSDRTPQLARDLHTLVGRTPSREDLAAVAAAAKGDTCLRTNPCQAGEGELESVLQESL